MVASDMDTREETDGGSREQEVVERGSGGGHRVRTRRLGQGQAHGVVVYAFIMALRLAAPLEKKQMEEKLSVTSVVMRTTGDASRLGVRSREMPV
jgi:hypothetical protein